MRRGGEKEEESLTLRRKDTEDLLESEPVPP